MAVDMKSMMADALTHLLFEENKKKITVKDIVEECHITRQAFYYHFADIPELIRWIIDQQGEVLFHKLSEFDTLEEGLRYWMLIGINGKSQIKKGFESNYGSEIEQIVFDQMVRLFTRLIDQNDCIDTGSSFEKELAIRYHCYAVSGLLKNWTAADTENLDRIVADICAIARGEIFSQCS